MSGGGGGQAENITSEVTKLVATLPPAVQAITGLDITKVCSVHCMYVLDVYVYVYRQIDEWMNNF